MPNKDQWPQIIDEWKNSGEIASQWCKKKKIHYPSFITWRKKLLSTPSCDKSKFLELVEDNTSSSLLEIKIGKFSLYLTKNFDEELVRQGLKLLRSL